MFVTRLRIPLSGFGGCIPYSLRGLSSFRVTPVLVVPAHPLLVPIFRSFEFFMYFLWFKISWLHSYMVPYLLVFCDMIRPVFLFFFPEYVEIILSYSVAYPIKSYVYCSRYFLFSHSIHNVICQCVVGCLCCWWL